MSEPNEAPRAATKSDVRSAIGKDTGVTIGLVALLIGGFFFWARDDTRWKTNMERDIAELRNDIDEIKGGTGDRWRMSDMRLWAERLDRMNPSVQVPSVDEAHSDHR